MRQELKRVLHKVKCAFYSTEHPHPFHWIGKMPFQLVANIPFIYWLIYTHINVSDRALSMLMCKSILRCMAILFHIDLHPKIPLCKLIVSRSGTNWISSRWMNIEQYSINFCIGWIQFVDCMIFWVKKIRAENFSRIGLICKCSWSFTQLRMKNEYRVTHVVAGSVFFLKKNRVTLKYWSVDTSKHTRLCHTNT